MNIRLFRRSLQGKSLILLKVFYVRSFNGQVLNPKSLIFWTLIFWIVTVTWNEFSCRTQEWSLYARKRSRLWPYLCCQSDLRSTVCLSLWICGKFRIFFSTTLSWKTCQIFMVPLKSSAAESYQSRITHNIVTYLFCALISLTTRFKT